MAIITGIFLHGLIKKKKNYKIFKNTLLDWIENNKFLFGINWFCGMEVGIRSINIIMRLTYSNLNLKDDYLKYKITKLLNQSAEYISTFQEVSNNGYANNHAVTSFTGLLFLALTLKNHPNILWLKQSLMVYNYV